MFKDRGGLLDKKIATGYREVVFVSPDAGVVKLVDAGDSKSPGLYVHVGSIPTSGTIFFRGLRYRLLKFHLAESPNRN
jgi:hypothetical protein